ncbi:hypothetical protein [Blastopirellula retiformator]|uniref:Flagellar MS-ring protein n=1 Tax=Blastopirellula retiformator TaxID=2527970 RepID=A0A5C5VP41_9BACT|nr:hypothetical protein [Blastopirellula retiformator]TWT39412.1 flagellar MS-ring protein [Blastopirellula retiformator]
MDFLNKAFEQIKDLFFSMTPGSRIIAGLLIVVIVASFAFLFQGSVFEHDTALLSGAPIDPADQKAVLAAFAAEGLDDYKVEGSQIFIPRGKRAEYVASIVKHNAIPPEFHQSMEDAVEAANPFESEQHRSDRQKVAKEKDLALVLRKMRGIEFASVHYDVEDKGGFPRRKVYTASVVVRPLGSEQIDQSLVRSIRNYVSYSIAGLSPEHVSVTDLNSRRTFSGDIENPAEDAYAARKQFFESAWQDKIAAALNYIDGVNVTVNVELDRKMNQREERLEHGARPIALLTSAEKRTEMNKVPREGGRPGLAAQAPNQQAELTTAPARESSMEESREETASVTDKTLMLSETASLTPQQVRVVVTVPQDYYENIWHKQNPPAAGAPPNKPDAGVVKKIEEDVKKSIESQVVTLLPPQPPGDDPYPQVHVTSVTRTDVATMPEPALADTALVWLGANWQTVAMIGVGLFALLMLRSMVNSQPDEPAMDQGIRLSAPPQMEEDEEETDISGMLKKRFTKNSPNLKDELIEMVREDPDTAAGILKNWINAAS